ncbi:plasmalemma vesicle associated protein b isoform X2 [Trichomycterus rosablanca]|uniref:plasmalemma vesicle associated protein b isoform X2 n=1 Tax=Trichomycterus rosablanca TaxID=2290929 RepID=UPI002F358ADE
MYNSSYKKPKFTLEAKNIQKSKGKSCGYYLRIIFFFSSLIQTLIIVSLVLFLVYGQPEKTAEEKRVEELEQGFNKLSGDNAKLRKEKADLTISHKAMTALKDACEKKVTKLSTELNTTKDNNTKTVHALALCNASKPPIVRNVIPSNPCPAVSTSNTQLKTLQTLLDQQRSLCNILQTNFSLTVQSLKLDLDNAIKDKNTQEMALIKLNQEKEDLTAELQLYTKKCKEEFVTSLQGIQEVTTAFLNRIDNLFSDTFIFHLTCSKQQEQMQKVHANCTNLSQQVENKFQHYLNSVGDRVSTLQARSSRLEIQNRRQTSEMQKCTQGRTEEVEQCTKLLKEAQQVQDRLVEPLLKTQKQLMQDKQMLQATCIQRPPVPKPSGPVMYGQQSRPGMSQPGAHTALQNTLGNNQSPKSPVSKPSGLDIPVMYGQQSKPGMSPPGAHTAVQNTSGSNQSPKVR